MCVCLTRYSRDGKIIITPYNNVIIVYILKKYHFLRIVKTNLKRGNYAKRVRQ